VPQGKLREKRVFPNLTFFCGMHRNKNLPKMNDSRFWLNVIFGTPCIRMSTGLQWQNSLQLIPVCKAKERRSRLLVLFVLFVELTSATLSLQLPSAKIPPDWLTHSVKAYVTTTYFQIRPQDYQDYRDIKF
jgi:hypothetical protein